MYAILILTLPVWFIIQVIYEAYKSNKTGSWQTINNTRSIDAHMKERNEAEARFNYSRDVNNPMRKHGKIYEQTMKRIDEKYAVPGTEAYKRIQEKEAAWDRGERW